MLQVQLFRMAQLRWDMTSEECERIFKEYALNEYIKTCYEEYHVQGDEANFADLEKFLKMKGLSV